MKQPEVSTVVALTDAASEAAMPVLRSWADFAPPAATGAAEAAAASATAGAITAGSSDKCVVFLMASVMKHGFIAEHAMVLCVGTCSRQQGASLLVKQRSAAAAMRIRQACLSTTFLQEREGAARPPGNAKNPNFCEKGSAPASSSVGSVGTV